VTPAGSASAHSTALLHVRPTSRPTTSQTHRTPCGAFHRPSNQLRRPLRSAAAQPGANQPKRGYRIRNEMQKSAELSTYGATISTIIVRPVPRGAKRKTLLPCRRVFARPGHENLGTRGTVLSRIQPTEDQAYTDRALYFGSPARSELSRPRPAERW
jgi:hypothetical protein